ncbi:MAG: hypothetical protein ACLQGP_01515 [Isosphaeraceae bacterium]
MLLELHALAIDDERARAYLAKPGCNAALGIACRAQALVKRFRVLRLLRDHHLPDDGPAARSGESRRWTVGTGGAFIDRETRFPGGSPTRSAGRSRRGTARVSWGE